jgi:Na+-driven multidrug efflux pump
MLTASNVLLGAVIRNTGDTRTPMVSSIGMNAIHLALNYGFIYGALGLPEWGLFGVTVSTLTSRALAFAFLLYRFGRCFGTPIRIREYVTFDRRLLREICRIGWPLTVGSASYAFAQVILYGVIASLGATALTARAYIGTIENIAITGGWALCIALGIQVAQHYGARRFTEAYESPRRVFRIGMAVMLGMILPMAIMAKPILHLFSSDEAVVGVASSLVWLTVLFMPCKMLNFAFNTPLVSIGDTRFVMVTNLFFTWIVCVGLSYELGIVLGLGIYGVYAAMIADEGIRGVLVFIRWRRTRLT